MKEIEEKKIKKVLTKRESMAIIYLVFSFEGIEKPEEREDFQ